MKYQQLLSVLALLGTQLINAQNTLDKAGLSSSTPASVAYSMRQLSTAYSGNAIDVRRSSDNTTQAIGFTVNGDLDTASLKTFVGAGDGFITNWYDQSGNARNLTQATAANQPSIVIAGVVIRENGRPFMRCPGINSSTNYKSLNLATAMTTVGHVSAIHRFEAGGLGFILGHTVNYYWHSEPGMFLISNSLSSTSVRNAAAWHNGTAYTPETIPWPSTLSLNQLEPSNPSSNTTWNTIGSDRNLYHNITGGGGYSELIIFPAALPAGDRSTFTINQGVYFGIAGLLPVTFSGFSGNVQGQTIQLQWQTANEQNSFEFIIERSNNGTAWKKAGSIPAAGNSTNAQAYTFTDHTPLNGINFYRIAQYDLDGKATYTSIIRLNIINNLPSLSVIGNPVNNGLLTVKVNNPTSASLYAADGRLLWNKQLMRGIESIDVSRYAKGLYFIMANDGVKKIVLQ